MCVCLIGSAFKLDSPGELSNDAIVQLFYGNRSSFTLKLYADAFKLSGFGSFRMACKTQTGDIENVFSTLDFLASDKNNNNNPTQLE